MPAHPPPVMHTVDKHLSVMKHFPKQNIVSAFLANLHASVTSQVPASIGDLQLTATM
jgi:hypothetical protein